MTCERLYISMALAGILGAGCGSGSMGATEGSGGSSESGGATGSGGTKGSGGSLGSGGTKGSGGSLGSGGSPGSGGATGSGGGLGSGGRTSSGGTSGTGGMLGTGGTAGRAGTGGTAGRAGSGGTTGGAGGTATGGGESGGHIGVGGAGGGGAAVSSSGCGKTPTLKNSPTSTANQNTLTVSGTSRQFLIRWPSNYDNTHPYRLILDFHGANGKDTDLAPTYFGLFNLSNNSTIFIAPSANGGLWDATTDSTFVDQILQTVEADLCIDTSRVELEGFSQGGAMIAVLACSRPGVFRAAVGHSRGGLTAPATCRPIPYLGSLGLSDVAGNSQATQTDAFATWDGCTIKTLPTAPTGGHICTAYSGCMAGEPVTWCSFDGPHTASPTDAGQSASWMPAEVWPFLSQF